MAKIKPVRIDVPAPKPELPKTMKDIVITTTLSHQLQYISSPDGLNWRCACGHVYPRVPMQTILVGSDAEAKWIQSYREAHERS